MSEARHRAPARHAAPKRWGTLLRPAVLATTVTAAVVAVGVSGSATTGARDVEVPDAAASGSESLGTIDLEALAESRRPRASRSAGRTARAVTFEPTAVDAGWASVALPVWSGPRKQAPQTRLLDKGTKVALTGQTDGIWAEVLLDGDRVRWVNADLLDEKKPKPPEPEEPEDGAAVQGLSAGACPDGSSIEYGLTSAATRVYRAVCAAFPEPTTYGGLDAHGEHVDGRAIDIMISGETGWAIAEWLRANAGTLGIRDIIYSQNIWTPEQSSSGWRGMSDRGSVTANHYDHVHVAVF